MIVMTKTIMLNVITMEETAVIIHGLEMGNVIHEIISVLVVILMEEIVEEFEKKNHAFLQLSINLIL